MTVVASFSARGDGTPNAGLAIDANGDIFGTTSAGGEFDEGTAFEIAKGTNGYASAPVTLVTFGATGLSGGENPNGGLVVDGDGNLYGTTQRGGGTNVLGTAFEVANTAIGYASTPTTLVSFSSPGPAGPNSGLIADATGDLFGTTRSDGQFSGGAVYEIARTATGYSTMPAVLGGPSLLTTGPLTGSLVPDAMGNLFGTTSTGGNGPGTVFELTGTGFDVPCYVTGTRIATPDGERAVESLAEGVLVVTASGKTRPIVWIGHRRVDCRRHPRPWDVLPVRISAGAFGPAQPRRDLVLSPDHAVFVDGR